MLPSILLVNSRNHLQAKAKVKKIAELPQKTKASLKKLNPKKPF